jgi:hypothetical protein
MQYCPECKVSISSKADKCPLCHKGLPRSDDQNEDYPCYEPIKEGRKKLVMIVSIIACAIIIVSVLVNILTWDGDYWCVVLSACVLYAWGLGLITFNKKMHLGWKLTAHAIAMPLLAIVFNLFATSASTISRISWAVSYAMPAVYICFIIAINIIMLKWRQERRDYLLYQLSLCVIGFVPMILGLSGIAQPVYLSIVAAACSYITILWLIFFAKKIIKTELVRKFHI